MALNTNIRTFLLIADREVQSVQREENRFWRRDRWSPVIALPQGLSSTNTPFQSMFKAMMHSRHTKVKPLRNT